MTTSDRIWLTITWVTVITVLAGWMVTINPWVLWPTLILAWLVGGGTTKLARGIAKIRLVFRQTQP